MSHHAGLFFFTQINTETYIGNRKEVKSGLCWTADGTRFPIFINYEKKQVTDEDRGGERDAAKFAAAIVNTDEGGILEMVLVATMDTGYATALDVAVSSTEGPTQVQHLL